MLNLPKFDWCIRYPIPMGLMILAPFLAGARPVSRPEVPEDSIPGIETVRDERAKVTYYSPRFDRWPQPDIMIYPAIARSDDGARTVAIRMDIKDVRMRSMDIFELRVDGVPVNLPLSQKDAVTFDASGCRSVTKVNVGKQEALVRRIATSRQVEVTFGKHDAKHYRLDTDDLDRFKKMLPLLDAKDLPPATPPSKEETKDGQAPIPGAETATPPRLVSTSPPHYPEKALTMRRPTSARVVLIAHVEKDGTVGALRVVQAAGGDCGFEEASLVAVKTWRYAPATRNGEPVDIDFPVIVDFSMR